MSDSELTGLMLLIKEFIKDKTVKSSSLFEKVGNGGEKGYFSNVFNWDFSSSPVENDLEDLFPALRTLLKEDNQNVEVCNLQSDELFSLHVSSGSSGSTDPAACSSNSENKKTVSPKESESLKQISDNSKMDLSNVFKPEMLTCSTPLAAKEVGDKKVKEKCVVEPICTSFSKSECLSKAVSNLEKDVLSNDKLADKLIQCENEVSSSIAAKRILFKEAAASQDTSDNGTAKSPPSKDSTPNSDNRKSGAGIYAVEFRKTEAYKLISSYSNQFDDDNSEPQTNEANFSLPKMQMEKKSITYESSDSLTMFSPIKNCSIVQRTNTSSSCVISTAVPVIPESVNGNVSVDKSPDVPSVIFINSTISSPQSNELGGATHNKALLLKDSTFNVDAEPVKKRVRFNEQLTETLGEKKPKSSKKKQTKRIQPDNEIGKSIIKSIIKLQNRPEKPNVSKCYDGANSICIDDSLDKIFNYPNVENKDAPSTSTIAKADTCKAPVRKSGRKKAKECTETALMPYCKENDSSLSTEAKIQELIAKTYLEKTGRSLDNDRKLAKLKESEEPKKKKKTVKPEKNKGKRNAELQEMKAIVTETISQGFKEIVNYLNSTKPVVYRQSSTRRIIKHKIAPKSKIIRKVIRKKPRACQKEISVQVTLSDLQPAKKKGEFVDVETQTSEELEIVVLDSFTDESLPIKKRKSSRIKDKSPNSTKGKDASGKITIKLPPKNKLSPANAKNNIQPPRIKKLKTKQMTLSQCLENKAALDDNVGASSLKMANNCDTDANFFESIVRYRDINLNATGKTASQESNYKGDNSYIDDLRIAEFLRENDMEMRCAASQNENLVNILEDIHLSSNTVGANAPPTPSPNLLPELEINKKGKPSKRPSIIQLYSESQNTYDLMQQRDTSFVSKEGQLIDKLLRVVKHPKNQLSLLYGKPSYFKRNLYNPIFDECLLVSNDVAESDDEIITSTAKTDCPRNGKVASCFDRSLSPILW